MANPRLITSVYSSQKFVRKLLVEETVVAVSVKQKHFENPGEIYLITVGTDDNRAFLFDIRQCPGIIHSGELWRILASCQMTKVMHDCRNASLQLRKQFGVHLQCVFDTQAAFCISMMQRDFPPRLIDMLSLYEKFGDLSKELSVPLLESIETGGIYWALRPMPKEMGVFAASEVMALLPTIYENIKSEICASKEEFEALCEEYMQGKSGTTVPSLKMPLRLNSQDQKFLRGTLPRGSTYN